MIWPAGVQKKGRCKGKKKGVQKIWERVRRGLVSNWGKGERTTASRVTTARKKKNSLWRGKKRAGDHEEYTQRGGFLFPLPGSSRPALVLIIWESWGVRSKTVNSVPRGGRERRVPAVEKRHVRKHLNNPNIPPGKI